MKYLLLIVGLFFINRMNGQERIFSGTTSSVLFTVQGNKVFSGSSTAANNCVYTMVTSGNQVKVCAGNATDIANAVFTFYNSRVYHGNSTAADHIAFTILGAAIYLANPSDFNTPIFRVNGNQVLQGNTSGVVATFTGNISKELLAILLR